VNSVVYGCTDGSEVRQYRSILTIAQKCWICQYGSILTITLTVTVTNVEFHHLLQSYLTNVLNYTLVKLDGIPS